MNPWDPWDPWNYFNSVSLYETFINFVSWDMKVIFRSRKALKIYATKHSQSRSSLTNWLKKLQHADWNIPKDIKSTFNNADILGQGSNRVIFNIGGNKYRMICRYCFNDEHTYLYVKWIGTHLEYGKLCKSGKQYTI